MPDPALTWSPGAVPGLLVSDRGEFSLHRRSGRWRVFRHGKVVSNALSSKALAIQTAEQLFADDPGATAEIRQVPGKPLVDILETTPADEIVLTNPPGGEQRPDPPPAESPPAAAHNAGTPSPTAPAARSDRIVATQHGADILVIPPEVRADGKLPRFLLRGTSKPVQKNGRSLKSWL